MKVFLSYASEDRVLAEDIQLALAGAGHEVFFDRQSLPAGGDYHERIRTAVAGADLFVFLISPDSVDAGGYALTEMGYARDKWAHPKGRVLPVMVRATPFTSIPAYLKSVTLLEPRGNAAAEVVAAAARLVETPTPGAPGAPSATLTPPKRAGGTAGTLKLGLIAAAVLLAAAAAVFFKPWVREDPELAKLERLIDAANTACVSNSDAQNAAKVGADLSLLLSKIKGEGGISEYRKKNVGANMALPAELQPPENAEIRKCMAAYMPGIFKAMGIDVATSKGTEPELPNPLQLRFSVAAPTPSRATVDETLRVNLQTRRRIVDGERLAAQPQGYYVHNTAYPEDGDKIVGTVARELRESTLTNAPAPSSFCLQRPNPLVPSADHHVHLDCNVNGACKLHFPSPKWLEICAVESPRTSRGFSLFPQAFAADEARKWSVPSAKTLAAHEGQLKGVGYTLIDVQTDVFQDSAVIGVEVDVRVNGTSILEDGLAPGQRPVPNDPAKPFRHTYALESLDFQGAQAGCEAITLTLRPRLADGKGLGTAQTATLAYVALRDKELKTIPFGKGSLTWSARYVIPADEWSHEAFITSLSYSAAEGETVAATTRTRAVALKQAFDRLGMNFQGRPLVAVIRPPLTLTGERLAYGLTAGVVQPSGQVRFTFSYQEANQIADAMLARRAADSAARAVVNRDKYIYKAAGNKQRQGTPTPPGVCAHVKPA
jgi:hypothetical protein